MKISRHSDGTYSITGMTRNDFSKLSFGACSDAAFVSQGWPGQDEQDREWNKTERENAARLHTVMLAMERAAGSGSIVVSSASCYGDLFFQDDERPSATASMAAAGRPLYLTGRQSATFEVNQHESLGLSIAQRETPWHLFDGKPVVCANTWPSR
jgi:hypothetical protein